MTPNKYLSNIKIKILYLILLLTFITYSKAQNNHHIKGKIIDVETKKNVDDVIITALKEQKNTISDTDGKFEIKIDGNDNELQRLHCYRIGYYDTIIETQKIDKPLLIKLRPKIYELGEVIVNSKINKNKFKIGYYDNITL